MSVQPAKWWNRGVGGTEWPGRGRRKVRGVAQVAAVAVLASSGCGFFDEEAEKRRLLDELELELTPMANGAEEMAQRHTGWWVLSQALLGDVLQEADPLSWISDAYQGPYVASNAWGQTRLLASAVEDRLYEELDIEDAESHPLMAQVRWATGLAELYVGMTFCEAVLDDDRLSDTQVLQRAEQSLGLAIATARRAGSPDYMNAARAGRALTRMLLEDWDGAESDATLVPAGFSYVSYHIAGDPNPLVQWMGDQHMRFGFLHKWWPLVEESEVPGFMIDPWSGEKDRRIPVHYDGSTLADSEVPHYRPLKYDSVEDDIPIVHYDMAQLIIAEARAVRGDRAGATAILNQLRAAVGLPPHDVPATAEEMEELILWERFAELHLEGQRLLDLHRKGLMRQVFEELNDPDRPGAGRPSKWGECETG